MARMGHTPEQVIAKLSEVGGFRARNHLAINDSLIASTEETISSWLSLNGYRWGAAGVSQVASSGIGLFHRPASPHSAGPSTGLSEQRIGGLHPAPG